MIRGFVKSFVCGFITVFAAVGAIHAAAQTPAAPTQAAAVLDGNYKLAAGDKVNIVVFDEPSMSGEFVVSSSGELAFPLVGNIQVRGLTLNDFQVALVNRLQPDILKNPKVTVSVLNYRPFYILGEVNQPGEYPYTDNLNVLNAVAKASGYTYRAKTTKIYIRRAGETEERVYDVNSDVKIAPGDTIRVAERYF